MRVTDRVNVRRIGGKLRARRLYPLTFRNYNCCGKTNQTHKYELTKTDLDSHVTRYQKLDSDLRG